LSILAALTAARNDVTLPALLQVEALKHRAKLHGASVPLAIFTAENGQYILAPP
jgi:hypothetical protein